MCGFGLHINLSIGQNQIYIGNWKVQQSHYTAITLTITPKTSTTVNYSIKWLWSFAMYRVKESERGKEKAKHRTCKKIPIHFAPCGIDTSSSQCYRRYTLHTYTYIHVRNLTHQRKQQKEVNKKKKNKKKFQRKPNSPWCMRRCLKCRNSKIQ